MKNGQLFRERHFHNTRFENPSLRSRRVSKFYSITGEVYDKLRTYLTQHGTRKRVLECGCGLGQTVFTLAKINANVLGVDISGVVLNQAIKRREPKCTQPQFSLMDVHRLGLASDSFDLVYGTGILHHAKIKDMLDELRRVLVPEGIGIFVEPLGHNPLLNMYRFLTPKIRSIDEHPLLMSDFALLPHYFEKIDLNFYYLMALAAVPFQKLPGGDWLLGFLKKIDQRLLAIPTLKRFAWIVLIELRAPKKL